MALLANLALFFVVFLPLTFAVAAPFDFYVGRFQPEAEASQLFYWIVVGWPVLLQSALFVPVAHAALGVARRAGFSGERGVLRRGALALFPLGLFAFHVLWWGDAFFSTPLFVSFLIPGAVFGAVARIPRSRSRLAG